MATTLPALEGRQWPRPAGPGGPGAATPCRLLIAGDAPACIYPPLKGIYTHPSASTRRCSALPAFVVLSRAPFFVILSCAFPPCHPEPAEPAKDLPFDTSSKQKEDPSLRSG